MAAKQTMGTLHYVEQTVYKAEKALVASKFNGVALNKQIFDTAKDSKKPEFTAINPTGIVPFLQTEMGVVFGSNAIARYVARCRTDTGLYGNCFDEEGCIDTWIDFCTHELEIPLMTWLYPVLGLMKDAPQATEAAKADVAKAFKQLEDRLKSSQFIVGDSLTLADISIACTLKEGFTRIFDAAFRKPYPKTTAWFERCVGMPQFKAVLGEVKLCSQASKPAQVASPKAKAEKQPAQQPKAKAEQKQAAPKKGASPKAKPAAAPAAAGSGDVEGEIKAVGDQIRTLKEKLKAEGLSGKKINDHEEIKSLVAKLQELKAQAEAGGGAAAAPAKAASPKASPKSSPKGSPKKAAASSGDIEAQVKAVGDEIRELKERLKGEGLSGKKINDHAEVKGLVTKLQELKAQMPA